MERLVLIDGNALVHRAYHALPPLTTKKGELVNAVYGFTTLLLRVLKELKPEYVATTFDLSAPTFRHEEYKDYKATRPKAPQELYDQMNRVKQVVGIFNIPIYEKAGYEADDVIGTICHQIKGVEIFIVTGDLDTLQLVTPLIKVYTLKGSLKDTIIYDEEKIRERYGLTQAQLTDFKGLKGDPSDNIPGVPGIGEKTAIELLKIFGTLENLYEKAEKIKEGQATPETMALLKRKSLLDKLLANKEQAFFSKYLATIKIDVPLTIDQETMRWKNYDRQKAIALFEELDFNSLINRLPDHHEKPAMPPDIHSQLNLL